MKYAKCLFSLFVALCLLFSSLSCISLAVAAPDTGIEWVLRFEDESGKEITNVADKNGTFWVSVGIKNYAGIIGEMRKVYDEDGGFDRTASEYDNTIAMGTIILNYDSDSIAAVGDDTENIIFDTPYSGQSSVFSCESRIHNIDPDVKQLRAIIKTDGGNAGMFYSVGKSDLDKNNGEIVRFKFKNTSVAEDLNSAFVQIVEDANGIGTALSCVNKTNADTSPTIHSIDFSSYDYSTEYLITLGSEPAPSVDRVNNWQGSVTTLISPDYTAAGGSYLKMTETELYIGDSVAVKGGTCMDGTFSYQNDSGKVATGKITDNAEWYCNGDWQFSSQLHNGKINGSESNNPVTFDKAGTWSCTVTVGGDTMLTLVEFEVNELPRVLRCSDGRVLYNGTVNNKFYLDHSIGQNAFIYYDINEMYVGDAISNGMTDNWENWLVQFTDNGEKYYGRIEQLDFYEPNGSHVDVINVGKGDSDKIVLNSAGEWIVMAQFKQVVDAHGNDVDDKCVIINSFIVDSCPVHNVSLLNTVKPSCTSKGYDEVYCSTCGLTERNNIVFAYGHQLSRIENTNTVYCKNCEYESVYADKPVQHELQISDTTGIKNYTTLPACAFVGDTVVNIDTLWSTSNFTFYGENGETLYGKVKKAYLVKNMTDEQIINCTKWDSRLFDLSNGNGSYTFSENGSYRLVGALEHTDSESGLNDILLFDLGKIDVFDVQAEAAVEWTLRFEDDEGNEITNVLNPDDHFWISVGIKNYDGFIGEINKVYDEYGKLNISASTYMNTIAMGNVFINYDPNLIESINETDSNNVAFDTPYSAMSDCFTCVSNTVSSGDDSKQLRAVFKTDDSKAGTVFSIGKNDLDKNDGRIIRFKFKNKVTELNATSVQIVNQDNSSCSGLACISKPTAESVLRVRPVDFNTYDYNTKYSIELGKPIPNAPDAPTAESVTAESVTLIAHDGYEYSMNGETWQNENEFTGLDPHTEYTFYQRCAANDTHLASPASKGTVVLTDKAMQNAPSAPIVDALGAKSVVLLAVDGYEYSIDGHNWQTNCAFTGLSVNTEYSFYQRIAETDAYKASASSEATVVITKKLRQTAPVAPIVESVTDSSVILVKVVGCEYSIDGVTWQLSNEFTGLDSNTKYTFYQRVAETDFSYASAASDGIIVSTEKKAILSGDISGDGMIDSSDLLILSQHILYGESIDMSVADIDGDNAITAADLFLLQMIMLKVIQ